MLHRLIKCCERLGTEWLLDCISFGGEKEPSKHLPAPKNHGADDHAGSAAANKDLTHVVAACACHLIDSIASHPQGRSSICSSKFLRALLRRAMAFLRNDDNGGSAVVDKFATRRDDQNEHAASIVGYTVSALQRSSSRRSVAFDLLQAGAIGDVSEILRRELRHRTSDYSRKSTAPKSPRPTTTTTASERTVSYATALLTNLITARGASALDTLSDDSTVERLIDICVSLMLSPWSSLRPAVRSNAASIFYVLLSKPSIRGKVVLRGIVGDLTSSLESTKSEETRHDNQKKYDDGRTAFCHQLRCILNRLAMSDSERTTRVESSSIGWIDEKETNNRWDASDGYLSPSIVVPMAWRCDRRKTVDYDESSRTVDPTAEEDDGSLSPYAHPASSKTSSARRTTPRATIQQSAAQRRPVPTSAEVFERHFAATSFLYDDGSWRPRRIEWTQQPTTARWRERSLQDHVQNSAHRAATSSELQLHAAKPRRATPKTTLRVTSMPKNTRGATDATQVPSYQSRVQRAFRLSCEATAKRAAFAKSDNNAEEYVQDLVVDPSKLNISDIERLFEDTGAYDIMSKLRKWGNDAGQIDEVEWIGFFFYVADTFGREKSLDILREIELCLRWDSGLNVTIRDTFHDSLDAKTNIESVARRDDFVGEPSARVHTVRQAEGEYNDNDDDDSDGESSLSSLERELEDVARLERRSRRRVAVRQKIQEREINRRIREREKELRRMRRLPSSSLSASSSSSSSSASDVINDGSGNVVKDGSSRKNGKGLPEAKNGDDNDNNDDDNDGDDRPQTPVDVALAKTSSVCEESAKEKVKDPSWEACVDPETGETYYYDSATRRSTWTAPPNVESEDDLLPSEDDDATNEEHRVRPQTERENEKGGSLEEDNVENSDARREEDGLRLATMLQKLLRGRHARREFGSKRKLATSLSAMFRKRLERRRFLSARSLSTGLSAVHRGRRERRKFVAARLLSTRLAAAHRGRRDRKRFAAAKRLSTGLQALRRGREARRHLKAAQDLSRRLSAIYRGNKERKRFFAAKRIARAAQRVSRRRHRDRDQPVVVSTARQWDVDVPPGPMGIRLRRTRETPGSYISGFGLVDGKPSAVESAGVLVGSRIVRVANVDVSAYSHSEIIKILKRKVRDKKAVRFQERKNARVSVVV
eukprot:g2875.t1